MPQKFQQLKKSKKFSKSSKKWLLRQVNDQFVERARNEGWRSRATFKIIEIDEKFKIFKQHKIVVDLGCAPGGWSQYCVGKVGEGNVVAIDLLPISPIVGVNFMQLDFLSENASEKIIDELKKIKHNSSGLCDIVLSDMAANATGDQNTDHLRIIGLLEEALNLSQKILKNQGCFVGKIFQGGSSKEILNLLQQNFMSVKYFKPESSRKDSSETYLVASGFKGHEPEKIKIPI
jgi:23S rRNA (uridine2552-2'-O)-methyltransferase